MLKKWKVPVYYTMSGVVEVEAEDLETAIEIAGDESEDIPLPEDASYVSGSWEASDLDSEEIRYLYNDGQEDENEDEDESEEDW